MCHREIHAAAGQRTLVAVLAPGDEVVASLCELASRERLSAAQVAAIGAFERAVLAWFDWQAKDYRHIPVTEQVEVLSLGGDIALRSVPGSGSTAIFLRSSGPISGILPGATSGNPFPRGSRCQSSCGSDCRLPWSLRSPRCLFR